MTINATWTDIKTNLTANPSVAALQYVEFEGHYEVHLLYLGFELVVERLRKGSADCTEFETNYKALGNIPEASKVRITNCKVGRKLHDRYVTFTTADDQNFDNTDENQQSYGDFTYWMRDVNGDPTTVNGDAVQTVMDFHPRWNYEISGGYLFIPAGLPTPKSAWELHILGAPDIPAEYGGSLIFVANPRISFREGDFFFLDSSLNPAEVNGDVSALARKIRWILSHPQGAQAEFQLNMKVFR